MNYRKYWYFLWSKKSFRLYYKKKEVKIDIIVSAQLISLIIYDNFYKNIQTKSVRLKILLHEFDSLFFIV